MTTGQTTHWRVGITRDILDRRGEPAFGRAALGELDRAGGIAWEYLPEVVPAVTPEHASQYDALYVNAARVPATAVARADCGLPVHRSIELDELRLALSRRS